MATTRPDAPPRPTRRRQALLVAGTLAIGVGIIAAVPPMRHAVLFCLHGDLGGLRHYIRSLGAGGVALLLALMLVHALVYYPTEIVTATAAFVYGWLPGFALVTGGWLLSALLSYLLGVLLAGPFLHSLLGRRYPAALRAVRRGGLTLLLGYRIVPVVPFSLLGYAAGAARIPLWRFAWTTVVGYLPLTAAVAYLGSRAQSLSITDPLIWAVVAGLIALLVAGRRLAPAP